MRSRPPSPAEEDQPDGGVVSTTVVLAVLRAHGVSVAQNGEDFTLSKGDVIKVVVLPAMLRRRMLHALSRWFGVPIHHFFKPTLAPPIPLRSA